MACVKDKMVRRDSFWTSSLFLYLLVLFGVPLSLAFYQTGLDAYVSAHAYFFWQKRWIQDVSAFLSTLGQASTQALICFGMAFFYARKKMYDWARLWLFSIVVYLGVGFFAYFLKSGLGRPRPKMMQHMYDFQWLEFSARLHSYPSGHTITTFAWLACLVPFYGTKSRLTLFVLASIISLGRVSITAHYLGDVVFAAVIGYASATLWMKKKALGTENTVPLSWVERTFVSFSTAVQAGVKRFVFAVKKRIHQK